MRCIYFDEINPQKVEGIVKSIYSEINTLEDIKFLLKYASALFPPKPTEVNGKDLYAALLALRAKQKAEVHVFRLPPSS